MRVMMVAVLVTMALGSSLMCVHLYPLAILRRLHRSRSRFHSCTCWMVDNTQR